MRYLALLCAGLFLVSCGNDTHTSSTATTDSAMTTAPAAVPSSALGDTATTELMNMVSSYYNLKDALVASDAVKADAAASRLMSDAEGFKGTAAKQSTAAALQPQLESIQSASEAIVNAKADSIEAKRTHFSRLSDAMFALLKTAGLKNGGVYQQFCPMAFNDQGGYWLSAESEIMNPYLPKKMLHCGEVKDSL